VKLQQKCSHFIHNFLTCNEVNVRARFRATDENDAFPDVHAAVFGAVSPGANPSPPPPDDISRPGGLLRPPVNDSAAQEIDKIREVLCQHFPCFSDNPDKAAKEVATALGVDKNEIWGMSTDPWRVIYCVNLLDESKNSQWQLMPLVLGRNPFKERDWKNGSLVSSCGLRACVFCVTPKSTMALAP
jgi:hypothetical protein